MNSSAACSTTENASEACDHRERRQPEAAERRLVELDALEVPQKRQRDAGQQVAGAAREQHRLGEELRWIVDRDELEEDLVVARRVELDHAPVAAADAGRAEPAAPGLLAHQLGDVLLLAADADRAAHVLAEGEQVAAVTRANDREPGR
jgi:hypothetical protein